MTEKADRTALGNSVKISRERVLTATMDLPDEQREAVRWLHGYAVEKHLSLKALEDKLRYDSSTLSQLFSGKYTGSIENVCKEITAFRKLVQQRAAVKSVPFVETDLAQKIFKCCESALIYQRIFFIYGSSQIGKSAALEHFAAKSQDVIYVRMPEGGILGDLLYELALALKISTEHNSAQLKRKIKQAFDSRMTLIVDEVHQTFMTRGGVSRLRSVEFIREIYDRSRCGVVLVGTNVFRDEMQHGRHRKLLEQLDLRSLGVMQLPDVPTAKDLNVFAAAHGLPPASGAALELQTKVIRENRLSRWLSILQAARRIASRKEQKMTWEHVLTAHAGLKALGSY